MRPLEHSASRLLTRKRHRRLSLLIGTLCAAGVDLARAQSDGSPVDEGPPLLLRPAQTLSTTVMPSVKRIPIALSMQGMSGLRMARELSLPVAPAVGGDGQLAAPARATPVAVRMDEPESPLPFEAVRPGPPSTVASEAPSRPGDLPDLSAILGWAIPPVRWNGNAISTFNWNESSDGSKTFNQTQALNLHASSYIYRPWYAQVSGDIGLLGGTFEQKGNSSEANSKSRSTSLTYGGNLSLYPQSRYPFQAFVQRSDSRANATATAIDAQYTMMRMGVRQSYRPEVGSEDYSASADRSIVTTSNIRSVVDALQGSYANIIDNHSVNANVRYSRNSGDIGGQGSNLFSVNGTHSWRADEDLSVASSANFTNNQIRMLSGSGLSVNNSRIMQAYTSATWWPDPDLPLTVTGGGNFLNINTETETGQDNLTNISSYANALYRFSSNLTASGGLTLAQNQSSGNRQFSFGQNAQVSYSGNALIIGDYSYNWGTGGGISNQQFSSGEANRNLSGQIQHSLLRSITLGNASTITLNASQNFSVSDSSTLGQTGVLAHTGGASWHLGIGKSSQGMLSATVSDAISTGSYSSHFRSLSAQGSLQTRLTSRSALTANLNFILNQQLSATQKTASPSFSNSGSSSTLNGSGNVSYTHRNPFDIANLLYTATFQANASQTNLRLISGDPDALAWQTGRVFQQNLDYRLGRLMFRVTSSFATMNGKENASLFFTINREIGDF